MSSEKHALYAELLQQAKALLQEETDVIANMANFSALLFQSLPDLNWAGFYIMRQGELVLGPFQGKVACVRIPVGKGVCGTCVATGEIQRVADVHDRAVHTRSTTGGPGEHAVVLVAVLAERVQRQRLVVGVHERDRLVDRVDRDADPSDFALRERVIRVVAHLRRQIERDAQPARGILRGLLLRSCLRQRKSCPTERDRC